MIYSTHFESNWIDTLHHIVITPLELRYIHEASRSRGRSLESNSNCTCNSIVIVCLFDNTITIPFSNSIHKQSNCMKKSNCIKRKKYLYQTHNYNYFQLICPLHHTHLIFLSDQCFRFVCIAAWNIWQIALPSSNHHWLCHRWIQQLLEFFFSFFDYSRISKNIWSWILFLFVI